MNKQPKQYDIWIANLEPASGTEPGKIRPVVILQSDILHEAGHSSTIACAISSQPRQGISLIRIHVKATNENGLQRQSYILADQIRALDLSRLQEKIGKLDDETINYLRKSIKSILSFD